MKIYEMSNLATGEIFQAPFKTLYLLARSIWREAVRYHNFCWLDIHTPKTGPYRERCISLFVNLGDTEKKKIVNFSRG